MMKRRDFITLLGGAAVTWSLPLNAQQSGRRPHVGVLVGYADSDPLAEGHIAAFRQGLQQLGWPEDKIKFDIRFAAADPDRMRSYAAELAAAAPEVILTMTTPVTAAVLRATRKTPVVFVIVSDPVGSGFIETLSRPGGNVTGFVNLESSLVEKWVELLKEIAPQVTRVAMMFNPETAPYAGYYMRPFEAAARSLGMEPIGAPVRDDADIERVIARLGRDGKGGLVVMTDIYTTTHRGAINRLTTHHRVPAINSTPAITRDGGLVTYGVDTFDLFRRSASYVDRVLKGAKPGDLPVQVPTKFVMVVNTKTATGLGLTVPPALLVRADEVIE